MERLDSIDDEMRRIVTYKLSDGRQVQFGADLIARHGLAAAMRAYGLEDQMPTKRLPVMQDGLMIGTLPPDFDPGFVKSKTFLYDVRPGDFRRQGNAWIASPSLGPGDLLAVPGFAPA